MTFAELRQRRPRIKDERHLRFIRTLPCCVCRSRYQVEAAHLRQSSSEHDKIEAGVGAKPDDRWTTPLCSGHHRTLPDAQHAIGEEAFWEKHGIDPFKLCIALHEISGDQEAAETILRRAP